MASRLVLLLLLLSLFSTITFAKPSWKLVELKDEEGDHQDIGHDEADYDDPDETYEEAYDGGHEDYQVDGILR